MQPNRGSRPAFLALVLLLCCPPAGSASPPDTGRILADLERQHLPLSSSRSVQNLELQIGPARVVLPAGQIRWAPAAGGFGAEVVLRGKGRVVLPPLDAIEGEQMRLFTGAATLEATFQQAVLTVADPSFLAPWLERGPAGIREPGSRGEAQSLLDRWKGSPERERLQVDGALLRAAHGPADGDSFAAAWFLDGDHGDFLLRVDPGQAEPFWVGQLVRPDPDFAATQQLQRLLHRQQRQGRWSRLTLGDLGLLDTWTAGSASPPAEPTLSRFDFDHYRLDLELEPEQGSLRGTAHLELRRDAGSGRVVSLLLHPDLEVLGLRGSQGRALPFLRRGDQIHVVLDEPVPEPSLESRPETLEAEYAGPIFEAMPDRGFTLRDSFSWHPRGLGDRRSTWDVTLRWPVGLELVASGRVTNSGRGLRRRWERRRLDVPSSGFGFELGNFSEQRRTVGDLVVGFAFDSGLVRLSGGHFDALVDTVVDALTRFTELFGPLDIDRLQVVTVPRASSQTQGGFITLSDPMVADWGGLGTALGLDDLREVVVHEIAHLWWGEQIPWSGEEDRWLGEALANTLAAIWTTPGPAFTDTPRLEAPPPGRPDPLWLPMMNGRPVAEAGPPVLGQRLDSSLTLGLGAQEAILYGKGTKILQTLALRVGPAAFLGFLGNLARELQGQPFSTDVFLDTLAEHSGQDLSPFARRFVYGSGLETVLYQWGYRRQDDGRFELWIETEPEPPPRFGFRLRGDGTLLREEKAPQPKEPLRFRIPLQILLAEDRHPGAARERRLLTGQIEHDVAEGSRLELQIDERPEQIWLDLERKTLARCFDLGAHPGLGLLRRGRSLAIAGSPAEAQSVLRAALDATPIVPPAPSPRLGVSAGSGPQDLREQILHELFRVHLESGEIEAAEQALVQLRREAIRGPTPASAARLAIGRARLALRRDQPEQAYETLARARPERFLRDDPEPLLVLALAARATGRLEESEDALRRARRLGAAVEPPP